MTAHTPANPTIDRQARRWLQLEGLAVLIAGAFIVIAVWAYMHQAGQVQL